MRIKGYKTDTKASENYIQETSLNEFSFIYVI